MARSKSARAAACRPSAARASGVSLVSLITPILLLSVANVLLGWAEIYVPSGLAALIIAIVESLGILILPQYAEIAPRLAQDSGKGS